jgi:DNA-binding FadR family transcriptional regulator
MLERISRQPVTDVVLHQLLRLLEEGTLKPGDQLPTENTLMTEMGVSRPPVREALNTLVGMGLIEKSHGRGYYVRSVSLDQFLESKTTLFLDLRGQRRDLQEARMMLEVEILVKLARDGTDGEIQALWDWLAEARQAVQLQQYTIEQSAEFHTLLAKLTGNCILPLLVEFLHRLSMQNLSVQDFDPEKELKLHEQLIRIIESHDDNKAREGMRSHIIASQSEALT